MVLTRAEHNLYRFEPTAEEIKKAQEHIATHENHIADLDGQISKLFEHVRRIEEDKKRHTTEILKSKGVLTMARRSPPEILAKIFEVCVADGWTRAPIVLSQVCSAWREAAHIPRIWSHIYIDCNRGDPVARCALWLRMAAQWPLEVTLRVSEHHSIVDTVLETLVGQIHMWKTFTLEAPSVRLANYILNWITGVDAHILRQVYVRLTEDTLGDHPIHLLEPQGQLDGLRTAFRSAPILSTLHFYSDSERTWVGLPQITHLNLNLTECRISGAPPINESDILNVISDSPQLRSLSLCIPRLDARAVELDNPARVVTMGNLTDLTLTLPASWMSFVQHLRTPALVKLHLRCPDDSHGYAADTVREALRTFLELSAPPLRALEMYDIDVSQEDFAFMFVQLSRLEELRLHGSEILDETLLMLRPETGLLPEMKQLDLRWCGHLSGTALANLVLLRTEQGERASSLEEVTVINCSFVTEQDIITIAQRTTCRLLIRDEDYCSMLFLGFVATSVSLMAFIRA